MKFIVGLASVLVLSFTVEAGVARGFRIIYGNQQVSYPNSKAIAVRLQAANDDWSDPIGARLEFVRASTKGRFCANIKTQSVSGNAFAMYVTSREPQDRANDKWDELDFEFVGKSPTTAWTNVFHDGNDIGQGRAQPLGFNTDRKEARYCLRWELGRKAQWFVDGRLIREQSLAGWTKRLHPVFSYWGIRRGNAGTLEGWAGKQQLYPSRSIYARARNIRVLLKGSRGPSDF